MEAAAESDVPSEPVVELEDIDLSDVEEDTGDELDIMPLTIDDNSRVVLEGLKSCSSTDIRLCEKENSSCAFHSSGKDFFGETSSEEFDFSDDDALLSSPYSFQEINLDGILCGGINGHLNSSTFNHSSTVFKDGSLTNAEYISDDDKGVNAFERPVGPSTNEKVKKISSKLSAGLISSVKDVFSVKPDDITSLNIANSFSNAVYSKEDYLQEHNSKSPLMSCVEFLKTDISEDEATDVEEFSIELSDLKGRNSTVSVLDDAVRCRGKGGVMSLIQNNARKSSWTTELFSDDECSSEVNNSVMVRNKTKKRNSISNECKDVDECLTDEEVVDLDVKEWTETDESGGVRQITQIKTETSIKLEGDGDGSALDGDGLVSTTTSTTTRVVTSLINDPDGQSEFESTFVQQLSEDDIRQRCEITVNEVLNDNSTSKPEESENEE